MVDSFHSASEWLYGWDAVENLLSFPGARALCTGRSEISPPLRRPLPPLRHQPPMALSAGRTRRLAQPLASAAPLAQTSAVPLATHRTATPPALSPLGRQKNSGPLAPQVSPRSLASRAHHHPVAAHPLSKAATPAPLAAPSAPGLAALDPARRAQRCLDGGLQGVLSHRRWHPLRSPHRPRSLQPLSLGRL